MKKIVLLMAPLGLLSGCGSTNNVTSAITTGDSNRVATYHTISTHLALLNNQALSKLLAQKISTDQSIGGTTGLLDIEGTKVFFKKIALTDLERKPENILSTKNIFELPLYYQYGIGSAGFGAWRELFCVILTTNWVITGACQNFPLMYHWRVLPKKTHPPTTEELQKLEEGIAYWGRSPAIRARLEAMQNASADLGTLHGIYSLQT